MLKKLLKGCLTIAMVSALAIPAMAESSLNGRVRAWVESSSIKDGKSLTQMNADGRLGGTVTGEAGDWTGKGFVQLGLDPDSDPDAWSMRDFYVSLSNDALSIKLGRQYPFGIMKGGKWVGGWFAADSYWAGEMVSNGRADYLTVGLSQVGLTIIFGMDNFGSETDDATGDEYNMTTVGAVFSKELGALELAATFISQGFAIDKEYGDSVEKGEYDGKSQTDMAVAVDFDINEAMIVSFNYDMGSEQSGVEGSDAVNTTALELWFDMGLDDTMGISVGYGMKTVNDGTDNTTNSTLTNLSFRKNLGMVRLCAEYKATTKKDDDDGTDAGASKIAVGLRTHF